MNWAVWCVSNENAPTQVLYPDDLRCVITDDRSGANEFRNGQEAESSHAYDQHPLQDGPRTFTTNSMDNYHLAAALTAALLVDLST